MRSVFTTWVKNVHSLCVEGVVNRVNLSPTTKTYLPTTTNSWVKPQLFTHILDSFTPTIYTANFTSLPLVNPHLYTLSTYPTINKMNKK